MNKRVLLFWLFLLFVAAIMMEITLRWIGFQPGDLRPNWLSFKAVDSLYVIPQFKTGSDAILVADSSYWAQEHIAINSNGFRAANFQMKDTLKKRVLVIGDSFTWGLSARPMQDSAFCDLLSKDTSLQVFNLGIPAVDPLQYSLIAQRYVQELEPSVVLVMFFAGNDYMAHDRNASPDSEMYYWTNAGAVPADIDGRHFDDLQSAYHYLCNEKYYLKRPTSKFEWIVSKSSLLSRLYALQFRVQEKLQAMQTIRQPTITLKYLYRIVEICHTHQVNLRLVFIPEVKEVETNLVTRHATLLNDSTLKALWLLPDYQRSQYRDYPDGHWNNEGHLFVAQYLNKVLARDFK